MNKSILTNVDKVNTMQATNPKKSRGRPPKTHIEIIPKKKLAKMSLEQRKYAEYRLKNNQASRNSRRLRKIKDDDTFKELEHLQKVNKELKQKSENLDKKIEKIKESFQLMLKLK